MKKIILLLSVICLLSASVWAFAVEAGNQPDGFFAICTDRTGATMEVSDFCYNFGYHFGGFYSSDYSHNNPRMYLPVEYKEVVVGIPFADIDTIKFTDGDPEIIRVGWRRPALNIKLRDGSTLIVKLGRLGDANQRFTGKTEFGDFSLLVEEVRQIVFDHKRDKNAPRVGMEYDIHQGDINSKYTISIKTWQGTQATLLNAYQFILAHNYRGENLSLAFDVKIGMSSNAVGFDKIRSIRFREKGKPEAQMTTTSGKTIDISLSPEIWLGGNLDNFDSSLFSMGDFKNPYVLTVNLLNSKDPLYQYLREQFTPAARRLLSEYNHIRPPEESFQKALADELNRLLQGPCIFDKERFKQVTLTEQTQKLMEQSPTGENLIRLNWWLLAEAYPQEIMNWYKQEIMNWHKFGPARVKMSDVSSFEISKTVEK